MKRFLAVFAAACLLLCSVAPAYALEAPSTQTQQWYAADDDGCYALFMGKKQVGYLNNKGVYRQLNDDGTWSRPITLPPPQTIIVIVMPSPRPDPSDPYPGLSAPHWPTTWTGN